MDEELREGLMRSMELPAMTKHSEFPKFDRRVRHIKRWWWHWQDAIGEFVWLILALVFTVIFWLGLAGVLQWIKH